jgi:hypothetical protein
VHQQGLAQGVTIIALVGEQGRGPWRRDRDQRVGSGVVRCLAAGQDKAERASLIVTSGPKNPWDFARKAAA